MNKKRIVGGLLAAMCLATMIGVPIGVISAIRQYSIVDNVSMITAMLFASLPSFVMGLLLQLGFALNLGWFPATGADSMRHFILPAITLSTGTMATLTRMTRSTMLEVIRADYVRTARAKGVSEFKVVVKHALKNALIPVITYLGPLVAGLLTGSFIVESRFAIPGLGYYFVRSISDRDYTMIMGIVIFFGLFVVICNLVSDILLAIVDPRVKLAND